MIDISFARGDLLWLLLVAPFVAALGWWGGVRRGRISSPVMWLRLIAMMMLIVTLAQPLTVAGGDARNTIFVVDRSRSVAAGTGGDIEAWINGALDSAGDSERAAVILFGSSPVLSAPISDAGRIASNWSDNLAVDPDYTDIESALALARALPAGGSRRIVLVSDGAENLGSALNQASQAATDGAPIDVLVLPGHGDDDLRVEGASAPNAAWIGETVSVIASIASGAGGDGVVELVVDGVTIVQQNATFLPGLNTYTFQAPDLGPGFHALSVRVSGTTAMDAFPENNEAPLAIIVRDAPKLLLISPSGSDPGRLRGALERKGAVVTLTLPEDVSSRLSDLGVYDAFVLNNVPATLLSYDQMTGLQEATRSLGKGLVVVGGTGSYGPGSYAGTVLEETLPVTVKVTDGKERQRVALLLIMDKSGSMSYDPLGGTSKIEMAKEAAKLAVGALADGDQVGILTFNDTQQWVVSMMVIDGQTSRDHINAAIETITADGGTEIFPALQAGFAAIRNTETDVRHVVLLSDGKSRTGTIESYQQEIADAVADRTTLSTIAIGEDSDRELLARLAEFGYGRSHYTEKSEDIPRLTLQEAQGIGSQSVIRGAFHPIQVQASPIMSGFEPGDLPALEGYDYARAKSSARVVLTSERDDPILVKWQFGLGRVIAWTADDGADFAVAWNGWSGYDAFWANMIRWALPDPENRPINVRVERDGPEAVVNVVSVGQDGDYVELADTAATVTGPDGAVTVDIPLYQSGPGEYQFRIAAPLPGAYKIELHQQRGADTIDELASFSMPPSPELQFEADGAALLELIALRTGGRVLSIDDPGAAFSAEGLTGISLRTYQPIWMYPLLLAFFAFLAELAIRFEFLRRLRVALNR